MRTTDKPAAPLAPVCFPVALPTESLSAHPQELGPGTGLAERGWAEGPQVPPREQAPATDPPARPPAEPSWLLGPIWSHL